MMFRTKHDVRANSAACRPIDGILVPKGTKVMRVKSGRGYDFAVEALGDLQALGISHHDAKHYYAWVPADAVEEVEPLFTSSYATDGKCHNAEPGTYGHECGGTATWVGVNRNGFASGYCDQCKEHGSEARGVVTWHRRAETPLCARTLCLHRPGEKLPGVYCSYRYTGQIPCTGERRCFSRTPTTPMRLCASPTASNSASARG